MRIALAQYTSTLGDFKANELKILEVVKKLRAQKPDIIVFPELFLFGYPPGDLLERTALVDQQEKVLARLARVLPSEIAVVFGAVTKNKKLGKPFFNSAIWVHAKKVRAFHKSLLPNYDIFDDGRFFAGGDLSKNIVRFKGKKLLLTICEDLWGWHSKAWPSPYSANPIQNFKPGDVDLVLNLSASPFSCGKPKWRHEMIARTARALKAPLVYVNTVGAQDEIVFDGGSLVLDHRGQLRVRLAHFEEQVEVIDTNDLPKTVVERKVSDDEGLRLALVLGIREFCRKTNISKAHLGLSGGIDSAVVACLAAEALGAENITCVGLPGPFNDLRSLTIAQELAKNLKCQWLELSIAETYQTAVKTIEKSVGPQPFSVMHENLQARIRGFLLMALSNLNNSMLLTTGNKSEYATGYATLYGDMCGGLAPLGDLLKHQVVTIARHYEAQGLIPTWIIERPPSAELRENQTDQDSLPPYAVLDAAVEKIVSKRGQASSEVEKWLVLRLKATEFKRWQAAPILRVSAHAFGRGRRMPIAHRADEA